VRAVLGVGVTKRCVQRLDGMGRVDGDAGRYLLIELAKMVPTTMARKKRGEANTIGEPIVQSFMSPKEEKQAEKDKAKAKGGKKKK
jgi:hypothetical protein